jgi:hypothetical protein
MTRVYLAVVEEQDMAKKEKKKGETYGGGCWYVLEKSALGHVSRPKTNRISIRWSPPFSKRL